MLLKNITHKELKFILIADVRLKKPNIFFTIINNFIGHKIAKQIFMY